MEGSSNGRPQVMAREVPSFSKLSGSEDELGCCGYPDVIYKSKTTSPIFSSSNIPPVFKGEEPEVEMKGIPQVFAQAVNPNKADPVSQIDFTRLNSARQPMGQTPGTETILRREAPGSTITQVEAVEISIELSQAIIDSSLALEEGVGCVGIHAASLEETAAILDGITAFSQEGGDERGLLLEPGEITRIEKVFECATLYRKLRDERKKRSLAFVAGGVVLGTLFLIAAAS